MKDWKTLVARTISALVCLVGGAIIQISLWKSNGRTSLEALATHPYLWIVYILVALLVGEHCLRLMKR